MSALFDRTSIKGMELKNRLVRSATHEGMADENGFPTEDLFNLYERLAKGGVGLIITGFAFVSRDGKIDTMLGMDSDEHIPKYQELVKFVHQNGARIAMQINHCGRETIEEMIGTKPIAPSVVKAKSLFVTPREMTEEDIERVINDFAQASWRVKESGFDAVQIHGAHGYLINQFLSPYTNRRKDEWGGSLDNRMRFINEIYAQCRKQVGDDFPILIKINANDNIKKGLKLKESVVMAERLSNMGFDGIEVSCGIMEDGFTTFRGDVPMEAVLEEWPVYKNKSFLFHFVMKHFGEKLIKPLPFTQAFNRENAKKIKDKVNTPVFVVGGMTEPKIMKEIVENEDADYISLCRALINNPKFSEKILEGSLEPSKCLHCNLCLAYLLRNPLRCYHGKRVN